MGLNRDFLGNNIEQVNVRNLDLNVTSLKGINMYKRFMNSVANVTGTDMSKYKIVSKGQFAYNPMHVGRDRLLPIGLWKEDEEIIVSPAYNVFRIKNNSSLLPEFLMEWFRRPEFDRKAWFTTDSSVRGGFSWDALCEMPIVIPPKEEQAKILMIEIYKKQQMVTQEKRQILKTIGVEL